MTSDIKTKKIARISAVVLTIVATLSYASWLSYKDFTNFEKTMVSLVQKQLLTVAKTTASRLEGSIAHLSRELRILAENPDMQKELQKGNPKTDWTLTSVKNFYQLHEDGVQKLTILSSQGTVLYKSSGVESEPGPRTSESSLAYVLREQKPSISRWFLNQNAQPSISISEPVFYKGKFSGIIRWTIGLDTMSKFFLQCIEPRRGDYVWLLDEDATVLSHPYPERLGKNIMAWRVEKFPHYDWSILEGIVEKMKQGEVGAATYNCALHGKRIMAYAPVSIGNRSWSIGVFMDYSEITTPLYRHMALQIIKIVLFLLLLGFGGVIFYRRTKRDAAELIARNVELEQEVTERKRAEEALRESEEKLAGILDSVTDNMIIVDEQFNIIWANDMAQKSFGLGIIGQKCYVALHEEEQVCKECIVANCFADGRVDEFESEIVCADGKARTFWGTANVATTYEDGRPRTVLHLLRDITERKQAERKVRLLKQQIEYILGATKTSLDIIDPEFNVRYIDPKWQKAYGNPAGKKCYQYFAGRSEICPNCRMPKVLETREVVVSEGVLHKEANRPVQITTIPFQDEKGEWLVAEVKVDITERKQTEDRIRASLREKEALLKEIHHRVKNNLQVISSLLKLQSQHVQDEQSLDIFRESRNRIKTMALIHEKLYQSKDLTSIDFKGYIQYLIGDLCRSYGVDTNKIRLKTDIEDITFGIDIAIPCGLIINELISNSLKHAFPEGHGEIKIALHTANDDAVEMTVSDTGIGMPEELEPESSQSLGLKLVKILTKQIGGELVVERSPGTTFRLRFKELKYKRRI